MCDIVVRNEENGAILIELDGPVDDAEQLAVETALPFDCASCPQLDLATRETLEVGKLDQRAFEPRRADLESINSQRKDVFVDIECCRHISADPSAIVQRHATSILLARLVPVDDDPNHRTAPLSLMAHLDELHPVRAANGVDQLGERLC